MPNEKILILTAPGSMLVSELEAWKAAGWDVRFEGFPVEDRSGSMSDHDLSGIMEELNNLFKNLGSDVRVFQSAPMDMSSGMGDNFAFPTPDSFKKAGDIMVALDFSDNISTNQMDTFLQDLGYFKNEEDK